MSVFDVFVSVLLYCYTVKAFMDVEHKSFLDL